MSNRGGSKSLVIRLVVLVVLGTIAIVIALNMKSPLAISEAEVKQMLRDGSLRGLTLAEAAKKLQHAAPDTADGTVIFDFNQVEGWTGGKVCVDVINGKVTAVTWLSPGTDLEGAGNDVR